MSVFWRMFLHWNNEGQFAYCSWSSEKAIPSSMQGPRHWGLDISDVLACTKDHQAFGAQHYLIERMPSVTCFGRWWEITWWRVWWLLVSVVGLLSVTIESYQISHHQFLLLDLLLCQCRQMTFEGKRLGHFHACILGRELGLKSLHQ